MLPDEEFKHGRKKVLEHFLNMNRIYKTEHFFTLFEMCARQNHKRELTTLH